MTTTPSDRHPPLPPAVIRSGALEIDRERYLVTFAGRRIDLTYMEFHLLLAVAQGAGRMISYDDLARSFWQEASARTRRRLAVLVSRIRAKLDDGAACIDTVHRVGYRLLPVGELAA